MNLKEYQSLIKKLKIGKQLPDAVYLHDSAIKTIPPAIQKFLEKTISIVELEKATWNVIKFSKKEFRFTLLNYPDFFTDSYPVLKNCYTINLDTSTYRKINYTNSENPPILHRKETFLNPDHPSVQTFREITIEGEQAGLYENSRIIGFKKNWEELIRHKGYVLVDGRLQTNQQQKASSAKPTNSPPSKPTKKIYRHKTAIDRNSLSSPIQSLYRHDYLQGNYTLFDYGCDTYLKIICLNNYPCNLLFHFLIIPYEIYILRILLSRYHIVIFVYESFIRQGIMVWVFRKRQSGEIQSIDCGYVKNSQICFEFFQVRNVMSDNVMAKNELCFFCKLVNCPQFLVRNFIPWAEMNLLTLICSTNSKYFSFLVNFDIEK